MATRYLLTALIVVWSFIFFGEALATRNGTQHCRPFGEECIAPRMLVEKVKLVVGGKRTNRFGKIGGINTFSDIGHIGLTEYFENSTVNHDSANTSVGKELLRQFKVDQDLIILKLTTSSILRDNIVTVIGYLYYKHDDQFTPSLYQGLSWIYKAFRHHLIDTTKLLNILEAMAFQDPQNQLLTFFSELEKIVPEVLRCSAEVWKTAIMNQEVDLNNIIRPSKGSNMVDLLADIDMPLIQKIKERVIFNEKTERNANSKLSIYTGPLLAKTLSAVTDGSVVLTQPLLAMIILHLPFFRFDPEVEEASRFIVDVLRGGNIESWETISKLEEDETSCPSKLVRGALKRILKSPFVTSRRVKDAAAYLIPEIVYPTVEDINEGVTLMAPVVTKPKLDVLLLFSYLNVKGFPPDIMDARNRIVEAINTNVLDIYSVLIGFIRFDYNTPEDLLIGITNRIRRRYFDLDETVLDSVKALNSYILFRKRNAPFSIWSPKGIFDILSMLEAFGSPSIPKKISTLSKELLEVIIYEDIPWATLLSETELDRCKSPRQCFVKIFRNLLEQRSLDNKSTETLVTTLLNELDYNGEPFIFFIPDDKKSGKDFTRPPASILKNTSSPLNFSEYFQNNRSTLYNYLSRPDLLQLLGPSFDISHYKSKQELLHSVLTKSLSLEPAQEDVYLHESIKVKLAEIEAEDKSGAKEKAVREFEQDEKQGALPDYSDLITLLPNLQDDKNEIQKRSLMEFLNRSDLSIVLGPEFKPYKYENKFSLLIAVLNAALNVPEIKNNSSLRTAIIYYRGNINAHGIGDQIIAWKAVSRKVDFSELITELIDYDNLPDKVADAYDNFVLYVANVSVFDDLQFGFNTFVWKTKSLFTVGLLKHICTKKILPDSVKRAIETLIPHVKTSGVGEETPKYEDTIIQGKQEKLFQLF